MPRFETSKNNSISFRSQPREYYDKLKSKEQFNNYLVYKPDITKTKYNPFSQGIKFTQTKKNTTENLILNQNMIRDLKPKYLDDKYKRDGNIQRKIEILD